MGYVGLCDVIGVGFVSCGIWGFGVVFIVVWGSFWNGWEFFGDLVWLGEL